MTSDIYNTLYDLTPLQQAHRTHELAEGHKAIERTAKLRGTAQRLCRKAGIRVTAKQLEGRTDNQLSLLISTAQEALIERQS